MPNALHPYGLSSQNHQGGGARFISRLGAAVRSAIAGGIALTGGLRRPAARQSHHADSQRREDPAASPSPRRQHVPRQAGATPSAPAPRAGWIARRLWGNRRPPAFPNRPPLPDRDDKPFTPKDYPDFPPEVRAILKTPVGECDPDILCLVLAVVARHVAASIPPELGLGDPQALFSTLWGRLGALAAASGADAPPAEPESAAPAPDAPPQPAPQSTGTEPAYGAAPAEAPADAVPLTGPVFHRRRPPLERGGASRHGRRALPRACRWRLRRGRPGGPHHVPLRRLCYAACAGPP